MNDKILQVSNRYLHFHGHIADGKRLANHLRDLSNKAAEDLDTILNDFVFALECEYQLAYGLDEDDWELSEEDPYFKVGWR